jgi:hypothetical protein
MRLVGKPVPRSTVWRRRHTRSVRPTVSEVLEPRRLLAGTVTGVVFQDLDNDGVRDPADVEPVPGARVAGSTRWAWRGCDRT